MNKIIEWFTVNRVAANLLAVFVLVSGFLAIPKIKQEVFPEFSADWVMVRIPYPGAAPSEVEEGICAKVEEVVRGLQGVEQVVSTAGENMGVVSIELLPNTDVGKLIGEVKQKVDAIETFPEEAEKAVITEIVMRKQVINVAVSGEVGELALKRAGERVRDELLALPGITQLELVNVRPYEISIELPEQQLRRYGLTFDEVAEAIRQGSLDLPGGSIKTGVGEILLRTKGQAYRGADFEDLTLRVNPDGSRLRLGQVATVVDGFADTDLSSRFNGRPAVLVRVFRVGDQSALEISRLVKNYVARAEAGMPAGINLETWQDDSSYLRSRLGLLYRNGRAGLVLVFFILALFLRFRLAIWVTFGIPVSFLGTLWLMPAMDVSISLISLFAFIVVLGIVVDDAIVLGENIYTHQQRHGPGIKSTVSGALEVARPVVFGVLTTVAAFYPLLALEGHMGKVLRFIPLIVMPTLLFSLVECLFILPAHLRDLPTARPKKPGLWSRFQTRFAHGVEQFVLRIYQPFLETCLRWRYLTVATGVAGLAVVLASYSGGHVRFTFLPPVEGDNVFAFVTFPRGTTAEQTSKAARRIESAAAKVSAEILAEGVEGTNIFRQVLATVGMQPYRMEAEFAGGNYEANHFGSHKAEVHIEVAPSEERAISSQEIATRWRAAVGEIPGVSEIGFSAAIFSAGKPVNIRLSGPNLESLRTATVELKRRLKAYPGVEDISDTFRMGKREWVLRLRPGAEALGLTQAELARQVRQAFYGEEAQRIQRNRDDVRVMVRFPADERRSPEDVQRMRIRLKDGREVPFREVATVEMGRGFASIRRVDGRRSVNVTAEVDRTKAAPINKIVASLREKDLPALAAAYPGVRARFQGAREEQEETLGSLIRAYMVALVMIYALLAIPFKSYVQPFIVMCAIPFGLIGAVLGHLIMGMELTILSMFGVVALTGVVVNDSLVMVDFVNRNRPKFTDLIDAVRVSGVARFRAIWLTSLTTFAGLTPLVFFEESVQAQFLVPMAVSLSFGVIFATLVTLVLVPSLYMILEDFRTSWRWLYGKRGITVTPAGSLETLGR